jgi:integrase
MARKTGQIIRRGPEVWMVRIYTGRDPETGKRKYIGKAIHGGLRAAQAHLNKMLAERDVGRNIRSSRQTLDQYLNHWLDICARPRLRAKSFRDYTSLLARYIRPRLGSRPLGELSAAEIQTLYSELLKRELSARTIRYTHAVLISALRQAVRWKLLLTNPAEDVDLPRQSRRRCTLFDVEQAKQFIKAISGHEYETLFTLAITTGSCASRDGCSLMLRDLSPQRTTGISPPPAGSSEPAGDRRTSSHFRPTTTIQRSFWMFRDRIHRHIRFH